MKMQFVAYSTPVPPDQIPEEVERRFNYWLTKGAKAGPCLTCGLTSLDAVSYETKHNAKLGRYLRVYQMPASVSCEHRQEVDLTDTYKPHEDET